MTVVAIVNITVEIIMVTTVDKHTPAILNMDSPHTDVPTAWATEENEEDSEATYTERFCGAAWGKR